MPLLQLQNIHLAFGGPLLFDGASLRIERGERVALVGRNGTGKSTLLRVVSGELPPDDGDVTKEPGARIARLEQQVPRDISGPVFDRVADGVGELGRLMAEYHRLGVELAHDDGGQHDRLLQELEEVQHQLEAKGGWQLHNRVETAVTRLGLDADAEVSALSGGLKRRVLLARSLVSEPDLLLLDEPTNHLDIPSIEGLEELLVGFSGALLFVTHDRTFLRRLATRIVDLDRGRLKSYPGNYDTYLRKKEEELEVEAEHAALFDKKLAQEEAWIRQGIKARRTRNEGRVRVLQKMREERRARRQKTGQVKLRTDEAERSGKKVIEVKNASFAYDGGPQAGQNIIGDFSTLVRRGDKIGVIGPNGSGKTTLLRLLLGDLPPDTGTVEHGTRLEIAYFDQLRAALDEERSVADNVADGADKIQVGDNSRHVISYLQDFLFPPAQARSPVKSLSGGERNRLLLARLFTRPFNVLVMDEPTNDLDAETLELLEELLFDYSGTLLLVSHDRAFLDNVVTSTLVLEGDGRVGEYVGGYSDWLRQRPQAREEAEEKKADERRERPAKKARPKKRSYKENRELEVLPAQIEALESEQRSLHSKLSDPDFYKQAGDEVAAVRERLEALEGELETAYARWEELESLPE